MHYGKSAGQILGQFIAPFLLGRGADAMNLSWQPDEGSLGQILQLLKESQNPDTETQRSVEQVRGVGGRYSLRGAECALICCGIVVSGSHFTHSTHTHTKHTEIGDVESVPRLQQLPHFCLHQAED